MNTEIKKCFINGKFIGVKENEDTFVLQKTVDVKNVQSVVLRATALGLYFCKINGRRVGKDYLTPGMTSYLKMLQVQTYDVTDLFGDGENCIELTVNKGWFAGRFGLGRCLYGKQAAVLACLNIVDANGSREVVTDESWAAKQSTIVSSGIYDGEVQDFVRELKSLTPMECSFDKSVLVEQICEPVQDAERFSVQEVIRTPKGETVYDFGQNIAGVVEVQTDGAKEIVLQFAEILDQDGNFYKENLRTATGEARVRTAGKQVVRFEFTYYGFRYVKIVTENVRPEEIQAVARYTAMKQTGELSVSHAKLNRFIQNTLWSQRDNFVDIPTDCPQRDERLGWTGDINAFCTTAAYTYDIRAFINKWMADMRNDQVESGAIPCVIPGVVNPIDTIALWCDSAVMIPWKMYCQYGDESFLRDNYAMMKLYLQAREANTENGLTAKGFEFGDWLALDSEECAPQKVFGGTNLRFLGSVFYYECLILVIRIAEILGHTEDVRAYTERANRLLADIRNEYITPNGRIAVPTITAQVLALQFNLTEEKFRARVAKDLNENVIKHGCCVTTGFIGTPYLLFALADNGYMDTAVKVLLNEQYPGWLHEVDMGATTVWERWDSLLPDGTPNPNEMTSFNHYSYGSCVEFIWKRIAGIEPTQPGFKSVKIAPNPTKELEWVRSKYDSTYGEIVSDYRYEKGKIVYEITVPQGVKAEIVLPNEPPQKVVGGHYVFERKI